MATKKVPAPPPPIPPEVRVRKAQERFRRIRVPKGPDLGLGEFFLLIEVTAREKTIYVPLSIASGKKPTGFVYQIEATGDAMIAKASISGENVTQVTLGTILYARMPAHTTATFRILIEIRGQVPKTYRIVLNRMQYKFEPSEARYQKMELMLGTGTLRFT